jgi:CxxC motif-containing protein (DUF1111 family)
MRIKILAASIAVITLAGTTVAQADLLTFAKRLKLNTNATATAAATTSTAPVGLDGLTTAQKEAFTEGAGEFQSVETPEGGLGPIFNGASCAECHTAGGIGGASTVAVTRFGRTVNGKFDAMDALGGSLLQAKAIHPAAQEVVPASATIVAKRITTPLFGAGLIEAIPDLTIQLNALVPRLDGISGRVAVVTDVVSGKQRVGRFGWKAQQATLLAFSADAYVNEMGITSRFFPTENAPNGNQALLAEHDHVPDIEDAVNPATGRSDIDAAADFMRFLAPLPQRRATASSLTGGSIFAAINCTGCHTPVMFTGANAVSALSFKPVALFSDLLLHDMGTLGDGIEQGAAKGAEMRTAPLWGLRARTTFLHDGRATTVDAAIRAHAGEAAKSRSRYVALSATQRQQLLDFLNSN